MTQGELAAALGVTQSMVSVWRTGVYEMPREEVFRTEKLLGVSPGFLSEKLGYRPLEDGIGVSSVEEAVLADPLLADGDRHTLLALYKHLIGRPEPTPAKPKAAAKATRPRSATGRSAKA